MDEDQRLVALANMFAAFIESRFNVLSGRISFG